MKVGIYDDYPLCYIEDGEPKGFFVDILKHIAEKEDWELEFVYNSWADLLNALETGKIDMLLAVAYTPQRAEMFDFNEESFVSNWGVVISNKVLDCIFKLRNLKIAIVRKDIYATRFLKILSEFHISVNIREVNTYDEVFVLVDKKKVDAGVVSRLAAISRADVYSFMETSIVFSPVELKLAFRRGADVNKVIIPIIDKHLKETKENRSSVYWKAMDKYLKEPAEFPRWIRMFLLFSTIILAGLGLDVLILRNLVKQRTRELQRKSDELEHAYRDLERLNRSFSSTVESISKLAVYDISDEEFLKESLNLIFKHFHKAENGTISVFENNEWKIVEAIEQDIQVFKALKLSESEFNIPDSPIIVRNQQEVMRFLPENLTRELLKTKKDAEYIIITPLKSLGKIYGFVTLSTSKDSVDEISQKDLDALQQLTHIVASFYMLRDLLKKLGHFHKGVTIAFARAMELYSSYTKGHSEKVANYSTIIAEEMGLAKDVIKRIYWSALLHDIGKIGVPLSILEKPEKLLKEEFEIIKKHPVWGWEILIQIGGMEDIAKIVRHHHERWDGKGYPDGLKNFEIPVESRIIAVADGFDAMVSDRPYRKALSVEQAINELLKNSGTQFDPDVVKTFVTILTRKK
ncbi:MAG: transporter substrate-binding domain-containing protein [Thermotogae bacterium]|nr:transporter substrate-binding domain-containing protein [Thermotogota bacterium]